MHTCQGRIKNWTFLTLALALANYMCIVLPYGLSLYIHFDCCMVNIPLDIQVADKGSAFNYALLSIAVCIVAGLYNFDWRNVGYGLIARNNLFVILPITFYCSLCYAFSVTCLFPIIVSAERCSSQCSFTAVWAAKP